MEQGRETRETSGHVFDMAIQCIHIIKQRNRKDPNSYCLQSFGVTPAKDFTTLEGFRKYAKIISKDLSDYAVHLSTVRRFDYAKLQFRLSNVLYRVAECSDVYSRRGWLRLVAADLGDCHGDLCNMQYDQTSETSKPFDLRAHLRWHTVDRLVEKVKELQ